MKIKTLKFKTILNFFLILVVILSACGINKGREYYIFTDINECLNLEIIEEIVKVEKYDSTEKDTDIVFLKYNYFYGAKIECSNYQFEIFAYEFENDNISKRYFEAVSGREYSGESAFFGSGGITLYTLVVVDLNMAYKINTSSKDIENVKDLLANAFSKKLDFVD